MSTDLPAMRRFKDHFLRATSNALVMWLSTELAPAFDRGEEWDPFVTLVADVEAEGSALIGARPCRVDHGYDGVGLSSGEMHPSAYLLGQACPECGAAL